MADYDRAILEHYHLPTAYPVEWPAEKDASDGSDEEHEEKHEAAPQVQEPRRRQKSRFSALEQVASDRRRRSLVPGSQKTGTGAQNLVQRDEPDPLGSTMSVVRVLGQLGLPIQDDATLRSYNPVIHK
jgi:exocyst complex component 2